MRKITVNIGKVESPTIRVVMKTQWVDSDTDYSRSDCTESCGMYCHCSRVLNAKVKSVDISTIQFEITKDGSKKLYKPTLIEKYCIDRVVRIFKMYDANSWTPNIVGGYYGEEVQGVKWVGSASEWSITNTITEMLFLDTDIAKLKFILEKEYSYLIDAVEDATHCHVIAVNTENLRRQDEYFNRVKRDEVKEYHLDKNLPLGIIKNGRLLDGYHRTAVAGSGTFTYIELF